MFDHFQPRDHTGMRLESLFPDNNELGGKVKKSVVGSLMVSSLLVSTSAFAAAPNDSASASILNLVADTAGKICGDVPDSGYNVDASAKAEVDVPLGEFFRKLFDARATGNVGISGGKYAGPLREQLLQVRRDTQDCRKVVADQLLKYIMETQKTQNVPESKRVQVGSMRLVPNVVRYPKDSAEDFANRFINYIDVGNYSAAYQMMDPSIRAMQSYKTLSEIMSATSAGCYPARSRTELTLQSRLIPASQSMFRRDEYGYSFRTKFKGGEYSRDGDADEIVGVVLSDSGAWQIMEFTSACLTSHSAGR